MCKPLALLVLLLIAPACAYHTPTAPTPLATTPSPAAAASIRLVSASRPDHGTDIVATVLTAAGGFVAGTRVEFSTSAGSLSVQAGTTDETGTVRSVLTTSTTASVRAQSAGLDAVITVPGVAVPPQTTPPVFPVPVPTAPTPPPSVPPTPTPTPIPAAPSLTLLTSVSTAPVGTVITFGISGTGVGLTGWTWTFGDGATATNTQATMTHAYATANTYTASVSATDALGRTASSQATIVITPPPPPTPPAPAPSPSVSITLGCNPGTHGTATVCNASAIDQTGAVVTSQINGVAVTWDWGDGQTTAAGSVLGQHVYTQAGTYTVIVVVPYNGVRGTATKSVIVP